MTYPRFQLSRGFKFVKSVAGDLTPSVANTNWSVIHASLFDITVSAQIGDVLAALFSFRMSGGNNTFVDAFTIVGSTPTNGVSGNAYSSSSGAGCGGLFLPQNGSAGISSEQLYTVVSGDISGGTVTLRPYVRQNTSGTVLNVFAAAGSGAAMFGVANLGPVDPN